MVLTAWTDILGSTMLGRYPYCVAQSKVPSKISNSQLQKKKHQSCPMSFDLATHYHQSKFCHGDDSRRLSNKGHCTSCSYQSTRHTRQKWQRLLLPPWSPPHLPPWPLSPIMPSTNTARLRVVVVRIVICRG